MMQAALPSDLDRLNITSQRKPRQPGRIDVRCKAATAATIAGSWEEGTFCKEQSIRTSPQSLNLLVLGR